MKDITTQKIVKGEGAKTFTKKIARQEFQRIIQYTDQDPAHKEKLEILDASLCRYKDIYQMQIFADIKIYIPINITLSK